MNHHIEEIIAQFEKADFYPLLGTDERDFEGAMTKEEVKNWLRTTLLTYAAKEREELREKVSQLRRDENLLTSRGYMSTKGTLNHFANEMLDDVLALLTELPTSPKEKV